MVTKYQTDASVFLNEDHCRAIEALLEPIVEVASKMECLVARLTGAATVSNITSKSNNSNAGVNLDENMMYPSLGSLYSSQPSFCAATPTLLALNIAALHEVSHTILEGLCHDLPEGVSTSMN